MNSDCQFKRAFALKKRKNSRQKKVDDFTTLDKTTEHNVTTPFYAFRSQEQTNSDGVGRLLNVTLAR